VRWPSNERRKKALIHFCSITREGLGLTRLATLSLYRQLLTAGPAWRVKLKVILQLLRGLANYRHRLRWSNSSSMRKQFTLDRRITVVALCSRVTPTKGRT
jgi:hypothetical protein